MTIDIIALAAEAGFEIRTYTDGKKGVQLDYYDGTETLARFAALVIEECARASELRASDNYEGAHVAQEIRRLSPDYP